MFKPDAREAAMLLLYALEERGLRRGKEMTRARLSRVTLKRLWNRESVDDRWLAEVNEWLLSSGWTLVYASSTFGIVKKTVVENWPRIASKHLQSVIDEMKKGGLDFSLENLLIQQRAAHNEKRAAEDGADNETEEEEA